MGSSTLTVIASIVSVLLGGGLVGTILTYRVKIKTLTSEDRKELRAQQRLDFETLLRVVTDQRDEAYQKVTSYDSKFQNMELEIQGLRLSAEIDPFPNWIVDLEGRYIFVNREFEKQFLEPVDMNYRELIGQQHNRIWPDAFCKVLQNLDFVARARPDGRARAKTAVGDREITVHKFPIRIKGIPVAYAGYITDVEPIAPEAPAE